MRQEYKPPLLIDEQIIYLEENKNVVYNIIGKKEAEEFLYTHNYINVISPFKYRFAKKTANGTIERDADGKHIYENKIDFQNYCLAYSNERNLYPVIYSNIMKFEVVLNAIVSYEVITNYNLKNYSSFKNFVNSMITNIETMDIKDSVAKNLILEISSLKKLINKYEDVYIALDRMTLSQTIAVYRCVDSKIRGKIFIALLKANVTFGYYSAGSFNDFLLRIVPNKLPRGRALKCPLDTCLLSSFEAGY